MDKPTPLSDRAIAEDFPAFVARLRARLERGRTDYGDNSFEVPLPQLIQEVGQELEDLAGWGFILWSRVKTLERKVEELTSPRRRTSDAPRVPCECGFAAGLSGRCVCEPKRADVRMGWPGQCSAVIGSAPVGWDGAPD